MTDNLFEMAPMRYWAPTSSMSPEVKRQHLEQMIAHGDYIWSRKYDGNWSRAVITPERSALQTRGISKKTGTYGEIQNKVFFWNDVVKAFSRETVILGEIYLPGGIDKDVGSILRCLDTKAQARQKDKKLEWRVFDILYLDGENMMGKPAEERIKFIPEVVRRINSPLVIGIDYHYMDENFFDDLNNIFAEGGEGAVCYRRSSIYIPGKRGPSAWETCKVKQEISADIDCFITGIEPAVRDYTGKDIQTWNFWEDERSGEKLVGQLYGDYRTGRAIRPISKGYYYGWPGAIYTSVYDNNENIIPLCKVAGLTEDFKTELRDNFPEWNMCPLTIGGMMVSTAQAESDGTGISIRHPYIKSIRKNDIDPKDCTLAKILS
jgi:hypothetical protein